MSTSCGIRPSVLGLALVLTLFAADSRSVTLCLPRNGFKKTSNSKTLLFFRS